jgi:hypothetical protein
VRVIKNGEFIVAFYEHKSTSEGFYHILIERKHFFIITVMLPIAAASSKVRTSVAFIARFGTLHLIVLRPIIVFLHLYILNNVGISFS